MIITLKEKVTSILVLFFAVIMIAYSWNIPDDTADTDIFIILDLDSDYLNPVVHTGKDNSTRNGLTNFNQSGTNFSSFFDGGRDENGAYQIKSGGNFALHNSSNPFYLLANNSGTICFSMYPNESATAASSDIVGAGASGNPSGNIVFVRPDDLFRFQQQCTNASEISIDIEFTFQPNTEWLTVCRGWFVTGGVPFMWGSVLNQRNISNSSNWKMAESSGIRPCSPAFDGYGVEGADPRNGISFGEGKGADAPDFDFAIDVITAWSRNISIQDILEYHRGNTTGSQKPLNISVPTPANSTLTPVSYLTTEIDFNATVNATRSFNATLYINVTPGNNNLVWNITRNYSAGRDVFVNFTVNLKEGNYRYFIHVNDTEGYTANTNVFTINVSSSEPTSLNNTNPHFLNNTYFGIGTINVNLSVNATNTFWINVSLNTTSSQTGSWGASIYNMTRAGGQSIKISNVSISLSDGDYILIVNLTDTAGNNNQTIPQWFFIDRTTPNIAYYNPPFPTNLSNRNLTVNLSVADNRIFNASILVWRQRELVHALYYDRNNASVTASPNNFSINTTLNFTIDYNYTIESLVYDGNGSLTDSNILRQNSTYYYDNIAPAVNISYPRNNTVIGATTFNISIGVIENTTLSDATCYYRVVTAIERTEVLSQATFNCTNTNLTITTQEDVALNLLVNISDKFFRSDYFNNFTINNEEPTSRGESSGGGGLISASQQINITLQTQEIIKQLLTQKKLDYTFKTSKMAVKSNLYASFGHQRMIEVVVDNLKETIPLVLLSCEGSDCNWITFQNQSFSVTGGSKVVVPVTINVPLEAKKGGYAFKLLATVGTEVRAIDLMINVGFIGKLIKPRQILFFTSSPASVATSFAIFISMTSAFVFATVIKDPFRRRFIVLFSLILGAVSAVAIILATV